MKEIGRLWNELSPEQKQVYNEKAKNARDRHQEELAEDPEKEQPVTLNSCVSGSGHFK